ARPDVRPGATPRVRPGAKPSPRPGITRGAKPSPRLGITPGAKPSPRPGITPGAGPGSGAGHGQTYDRSAQRGAHGSQELLTDLRSGRRRRLHDSRGAGNGVGRS